MELDLGSGGLVTDLRERLLLAGGGRGGLAAEHVAIQQRADGGAQERAHPIHLQHTRTSN